MKKSRAVCVLETGEAVAHAAAEQFVSLARDAIDDHEVFSVSLAGGSTPRGMYALLAGDSFRSRVEWRMVHLFFGDERCVPQNHPESNYRMAFDALISRIEIPATNVHPIIGEGDPDENARRYEAELRSFFSNRSKPQFDLVLLGLGEDGHTASLFPNTKALYEQQAWVVANWVENFGSYRITVTAPAINGAANATFMIVGVEKAPAVAGVLGGPVNPQELPAQLVQPENGQLTWLLDSQAASLLPEAIRSSAIHVAQRPKHDDED